MRYKAFHITTAHWGHPLINFQGTKTRQELLLKFLSLTEEKTLEYGLGVVFEGESLLLQLKDNLI